MQLFSRHVRIYYIQVWGGNIKSMHFRNKAQRVMKSLTIANGCFEQALCGVGI